MDDEEFEARRADNQLAFFLDRDCGIKHREADRARLGVGDIIAQAPLTRWLANKHGSLTLPVHPAHDWRDEQGNLHPGNLVTAQSIFVNDPKVTVVALDEAIKGWTGNEIDPGTQLILGVMEEFDPNVEVPVGVDQYRWLYETMGLSYERRWSEELNPIPAAAKLVRQVEPPKGDYIFSHDTPEFRISAKYDSRETGLPIFRPTPRPGTSILCFAKAIENALFVDVIDSAFFHLADMLFPVGELRLHLYARPFIKIWHEYITKHVWHRLRWA